MGAPQLWELTQYQPAAEQVCYRLGEQPHQQIIPCGFGEMHPAWMVHALRMHHLKVTVEAMRQYGFSL